MGTELGPLDIQGIMARIPHRYPFLLLDGVTEHTMGQRIRGYKNVSANEPYFQGHFPGNPLMPGVLQLEAMAQLGSVLIKSVPGNEGKLGVFAGIDNVRFRRMVRPGDRLDMEAVLTKFRPPIGKSSCKAWVNGELVVEADLMFSLIDA
jgi:3-hydroxyacyl-[acyl-carrier-protein] dehydratase